MNPYLGSGTMLLAAAVALWALWYFRWDVHRSEGRSADRAADKLSLQAKDKIAHFIAAAAFAALGILILNVPWGIAALIAFLSGVALEIIQKNPRDRLTAGGGYASWKDLVADAAGALIGALLGLLIRTIFLGGGP